jgi:hypothetical protein
MQKQKSIMEHERSHETYFERMTEKERKAWEAISNMELSLRIKASLK